MSVGRIGNLVALFGILLPIASAQAGVRHVSTTGSDSNPGTSDQPWRTIQFAVTNNTTQAGDEIRIRAGLYTEAVVNDTTANGKSELILKGGYDAAWNWDPASNPTMIQAPSASHSAIHLIGAGNWKNQIIGLTLTGGEHGLRAQNTGTGSPTTAQRLEWQHLVSHCIITNNAAHGVYVHGGKMGFRVYNSLIADNGTHGVYKYVDNGGDSFIYNATIADNGGDGYQSHWGYNHTRPCTIINSIIAGNGGRGVARNNGGSHWVHVRASCLYGNANGDIDGVNVVVHDGVIRADLMFVGDGSYKLQDGSPGIAMGIDLATEGIADDLEGIARMEDYDMGCYQSAFAAPTLYAVTYVNGATGDDANTGNDPGLAKKTIGAALAVTAEGGTCHVAAGAYGEQVFLSRKGVTLEGAGRDATVITNSLVCNVWLTTDNTTLRRFTLAGARYTGSTEGYGVSFADGNRATNTVVDQCVIRDNTIGVRNQPLSSANPAYLTMNRSIITNNTSHGIHLSGSKDGLILRNCLIAGNGGDGYRKMVDNGLHDYFYNCTIADNAGNGLNATHAAGYDRSIHLYNSIVVGNGDHGIRRDFGTYIDHLYNSCIFGNGIDMNGRLLLSGGAISADPMFVGGGDYRLREGSPCAATGRDTSGEGILVDLDGNPRVAYDMGGYESGLEAAPKHPTIYVNAATGDDANPGADPNEPKRTVSAGITATAEGGTCHVAPGIYTHTAVFPSANITLAGDEAANTILSTPSSHVVWMQGTNSILRNVTVEGGRFGVTFASDVTATNWIVEKCVLRDLSDWGVGNADGTASVNRRFTLRQSVLLNIEHGVRLSQKTAVHVENCLFVSNVNGIYSISDNSGFPNLVLGCTFADPRDYGYFDAHAYGSRVDIVNSIIVGSGSAGIRYHTNHRDGYISYSCVSNAVNYDIRGTSTIQVGDGMLTDVDPMFKAPDNFVLDPDSPGLFAGVNWPGFDVDIAGNPRPSRPGLNPSMGAYEFVSPQGTMIFIR